MKTRKFLIALALVSLFSLGSLFAADAKMDAPAAKPANCCVKAIKAGADCTHECCVAAAKAGNNCEKCKGSGKIADNPVVATSEPKK